MTPYKQRLLAGVRDFLTLAGPAGAREWAKANSHIYEPIQAAEATVVSCHDHQAKAAFRVFIDAWFAAFAAFVNHNAALPEGEKQDLRWAGLWHSGPETGLPFQWDGRAYHLADFTWPDGSETDFSFTLISRTPATQPEGHYITAPELAFLEYSCSAEETPHAAAAFMKTRRVFPGARIESVGKRPFFPEVFR